MWFCEDAKEEKGKEKEKDKAEEGKPKGVAG